MQQEWLNHPVFICGHPKSGTTLMVSLLDNHPQVLNVPEESYYYREIHPIFFKKEHSINDPVKRFIEEVDRTPLNRFGTEGVDDSIAGNYDYSGIDYNVFQSAISNFIGEDIDSPTFIKSIAYAFAAASVNINNTDKIKHWIEKTTRNERFLHQILKDFPAAKFIHIIRDPRDNWVSYSKKHPGLKLFTFCRNWADSAKKALQYSKDYGEEKYLVIRYEDLIIDQESILRKIRSFLSIDDSESLREPSKNGEPWLGNSMWGNRKEGINTDALERYKKWDKQDEVVKIESILGPLMKKYNYSRSKPTTPGPRLRYKFYWSLKKLIGRA